MIRTVQIPRMYRCPIVGIERIHSNRESDIIKASGAIAGHLRVPLNGRMNWFGCAQKGFMELDECG